jgi:ubiquinone/menaquinone biosynthesis C-methylase UbiE
MRRTTVEHYRCPYSGERLAIADPAACNGELVNGALVSASGRAFLVDDGIPVLFDQSAESLGVEEEREHAYYQASSDRYDSVMDWVFKSFREDENAFRGKMIDLLELTQGARVLETGAGTCRDSVHIARRLGPNGEFFVQDLSSHMLAIGRQRMHEGGPGLPRTEFFVGNAARLPFPDRFFDAAFHFGGINLFTDRAQAIAEMARVVRIGGKVVFGDESVAPWLRGTTYGEILQNSNKLYRHTPPIDVLPECARDACLRWLLGNAYYVIDFRVGDGPPPLDLDLPIVGRRGGTHRTRFYGTLEGVTVEAKAMAERAAQASGTSLHEWLDQTVRAAAATEVKR